MHFFIIKNKSTEIKVTRLSTKFVIIIHEKKAYFSRNFNMVYIRGVSKVFQVGSTIIFCTIIKFLRK